MARPRRDRGIPRKVNRRAALLRRATSPPASALALCPLLTAVRSSGGADPARVCQRAERTAERRGIERQQLPEGPLGARSRTLESLEQRELRDSEPRAPERLVVQPRDRARRTPHARAGAPEGGQRLRLHEVRGPRHAGGGK